MKKQFLIFLLFFIWACQAPKPEPFAVELLQQNEDVVSKIRQIPFTKHVKADWKDKNEIRKYIDDRIREEYTPEELENEKQLLVLLGIIPKEFDYKERVLSLLTQEVAGFYDPKVETLFLSNLVKPAELEGILVHELTHALQDQKFNLKPFLNRKDQDDDTVLALNALLEGEAMAVMFEYSMQKQNIPLDHQRAFETLYEQEIMNATTEEAIPAFLKKTFLFPYVDGMKFLLSIKNKKGWSGVDDLHKKHPESTEQILHPEKYLKDSPVRVDKKLDQSGINQKLLTTNVMGEFGVQLIFESKNYPFSSKVAEGWGGDRYWLFQGTDQKYVFYWKTIWDTQEDAEEFSKAWKNIFKTTPTLNKKEVFVTVGP